MKTILVDAVGTFVVEGKGIDQGMYELLESYPNKKIVVTNANADEIIQFGMTDLPYELYTLSHQPNKTDPAYFKKFIQEKNIGGEDLLYFEHNLDAVRSAESLGIASYHFDHEARDLAALKQFLDSSL